MPQAIKPDIENAAALIKKGGLVVMPTETVYGLAADATNDKAVARIFEAKDRPRFNPLIVHVAGVAMARAHAEWPALAERLAAEFWPGPLTLALKRRADSAVSLLVSAGLDTIALRAPRHAIAQALIGSVGRPLAAPSANRSGAVSPTRAEHARDGLGESAPIILDGGPCELGVESTIVAIDRDDAVLLRPGGVPRSEIEALIGKALADAPHSDRPAAPGMLARHYAPQTRLRLNAKAAADGEAFLGFGDIRGDGPDALNLSPEGDMREAAANLFDYLRRLDALCGERGLAVIAVAPIPAGGLGEAINDRLARAASPLI